MNKTLNETLNPWTPFEAHGIAFIVVILILVGVCGNALVIIVTISSQSIRSSVNLLIVSLAFSDLLSSLGLGFVVASLINGKWSYSKEMCNLNGFCALTFSLASALTISVISFNFYLSTREASTLLMKKWRAILLLALWIFSVVFAFLPILGWSKYEYFPSRGICFWRYSTSKSYTATFYVFAAPACLTAAFAYWKTYQFLQEGSRRVIPCTITTCGTAEKRSTSTQEAERKIAISIFVILFVYYTTLAPFTLLNVIESSNPRIHIPPWIDLSTFLLAVTNHVNNVFIYSVMVRKYRRAIKNLCYPRRGYKKRNVSAKAD